MKINLLLGFENEPEGIENFLEEQGFILYLGIPESGFPLLYVHEVGSIEITFTPDTKIGFYDKDTNWKGYEINSELKITYEGEEARDVAVRLIRELIKKFEVIDHQKNEFAY